MVYRKADFNLSFSSLGATAKAHHLGRGCPVRHQPDSTSFYDYDIPAVAIRPEGDKVMRMSAQTAKIEAGAVHLPHHTACLDDLKSELLAFPHSS
jgi:hypothetical protein